MIFIYNDDVLAVVNPAAGILKLPETTAARAAACLADNEIDDNAIAENKNRILDQML